MKKLVLVLAVLPVLSFAQVDVWKPGYVWDAAANTGVDVWYGPGNKVTTNGAFARGANVAAQAGGYNIAEVGKVALRDGRSVALTATRFASAGALAVAAAKLASGPVGIVAVLAIPTVYDWIMAEGQNNIRVNPTRTGVEKKDPAVCSVSPCYDYKVILDGVPTVSSSASSACTNGVTGWIYTSVNGNAHGANARITSGRCYGDKVRDSDGVVIGSLSSDVTLIPKGVQEANWLPSTMDDISPYMTPRLPAPDYPKQIIDAGGEIDVAPVSISGPSPALPQLPPAVKETTYAKPADITGPSVVVPGNPHGLAPNTPTVTNVSTSSSPLSPSSSTVSGSPSSPFPDHGPVTTPKTTTTTSTYNPTTDQTTSQDVTSQDAAKQTTTSTNITNITNTSSSSSVTNNTTNVTNVTNTTTNMPLAPTKTDTVTEKPVEDKRSECEKSPDTLGCMKVDDVPTDKVPTKTVTITWAEENLGLGAGSCPAPTPFHTALGDYSLDLTQYCSAITSYVRPLVLLFSLLAAFFIVAPVKET
ncbi:virulence factor TspB C-terminal domain-related protein [Rhodoferax ferrireducens]|uniref:virulence factor TspB C-terminal domain-related protein n=1 Tax=Rhodoferax ferrireducens TaxID=192843 RepID=UPI003BB563C3